MCQSLLPDRHAKLKQLRPQRALFFLFLSVLHKSLTHSCFRSCQSPAHILCSPAGEKPHHMRPCWTHKWSPSQVSPAWSVDSTTENLGPLEYIPNQSETYLPTAQKIKWDSFTKAFHIWNMYMLQGSTHY